MAPLTMERRLYWLVLLVLAMAVVESAVVVYLRELYCRDALLFPVLDFTGDTRVLRIGLVEMFREAATMVMLAAAAVLAGATPWQRWGFFMVSFGLWDLAYYGWLWAFLGWPSSLMTWDVLFLIPAPWTGPVLAPCLVSVALVGAGGVILARENLARGIRRLDWLLEALAGLVVVLAFCENSGACLLKTEAELRFPWVLFSSGLALGLAVFLAALRRGRGGEPPASSAELV